MTNGFLIYKIKSRGEEKGEKMFSVDFTKIGLAAPTKIARMNTGSSSWNYYIQNKDGEFLVKFLRKDHPLKEKTQKK